MVQYSGNNQQRLSGVREIEKIMDVKILLR